MLTYAALGGNLLRPRLKTRFGMFIRIEISHLPPFHSAMSQANQEIHDSAYIASTAVVLGQATIAAEASVWFGAVIRADTAEIRVGRRSNVQDGCILHAAPGFPCVIGQQVTLGHGAIVHGATIEDNVLIGMRAVVMNGAVIGTGSIVGVGAVVLEGTVLPPGSVVLGVPARHFRQATEKDAKSIEHAWTHYVELAQRYRRGEFPLQSVPDNLEDRTG